MLPRLRTLTLAVAPALCATAILTAPPAAAEVEPGGWQSVSPTFTEQERGCGQIDGLTFRKTIGNLSQLGTHVKGTLIKVKGTLIN
jgi:hypothetical protein